METETITLNYITYPWVCDVGCVTGTTDIVDKTVESILYGDHIKDSYYKVVDNLKLVVDKETGYFNATKMCNQYGKNFFQWARLDGSKDLLQKYKDNGGIDTYRIRGGPRNNINRQITGTYIPLKFLENIKEWIKQTDRGFVYVVTNGNLQPQNIYNIGFDKNIIRKMNTFNRYRQFEPQFYHTFLFESENAKDLKIWLHFILQKYDLGNDFFKVSPNQIVDAFLALGTNVY